ncbi:hypothetical protein NLX67_21230 [Domibacillus sp. A3M-37]|uniref:hypothetical protein n=1 Tax=Domibacillus sp. A3M-37 TaxID=2962037 RepID=UPI0020B67343|nr:hypothetical protein [Domibacillus sp. A3M-37]MCP3764846.1 hypothetical protein [Domibacillus sp. A3M-37]
MAEFERRDKSKAFKATPDTVEKINRIIKESHKTEAEFFEELVNNLSIEKVMDDAAVFAPDLRRHFESDIQKLKNATNSIMSIFASQMENLSVEKNQWESIMGKRLDDKQMELNVIQDQLDALNNLFQKNQSEHEELVQSHGIVLKERDTLLKRTEDQEQLISDRNEKIQDQQQRINQLNETIVSKDEELKAVGPILEENRQFTEAIKGLNQKIENLNESLTKQKEDSVDALAKQEETLNFVHSKELYEQEKQLTRQFSDEKEKLWDEVREKTEKAIRPFYLEEMERRETDLKNQIQQLQEQIKGQEQTKVPTPPKRNNRQNQKKPTQD